MLAAILPCFLASASGSAVVFNAILSSTSSGGFDQAAYKANLASFVNVSTDKVTLDVRQANEFDLITEISAESSYQALELAKKFNSIPVNSIVNGNQVRSFIHMVGTPDFNVDDYVTNVAMISGVDASAVSARVEGARLKVVSQVQTDSYQYALNVKSALAQLVTDTNVSSTILKVTVLSDSLSETISPKHIHHAPRAPPIRSTRANASLTPTAVIVVTAAGSIVAVAGVAVAVWFLCFANARKATAKAETKEVDAYQSGAPLLVLPARKLQCHAPENTIYGMLGRLAS